MPEISQFPTTEHELQLLLEDVSLTAAAALQQKWRTVQKRLQACQPVDKAQAQFNLMWLESKAKLDQKQQLKPSVTFPPELPISERRSEIAQLINRHQVVILAGETGSGKTTQLPKICLELGRGLKGKIGHTQPRRIAASTVAARIAQELAMPLGESVGYQVRFTDQCSDLAYVKLMTDGILLAEIQSDPLLLQYDTLIIDEAHERSLNIDFLLGYIKRILPKRPDLKVIVTSATIDLARFSAHFHDAPVLEVSGRTYPVEVLYRPPSDPDMDLSEQVVEAITEILNLSGCQRGDILVFVSGEKDIRELAHALRKANFPRLDILPLYARLSIAEQTRVFAPQANRRVVLATNVAETSITVPRIGYVVDTGLARISRYSVRTKVQRLPIEPVSQASANQRAGRCGRVSEGVCIRLYSQEDFDSRPAFTDAEILRTNLASVVLQMLHLRMGDIRHFPFVDMPDKRLIKDGYKVLEELQAVTSKGSLTKIGRQLANLPLDPRLGRMLIAAHQQQALSEVMVIAAALAASDPRERPAEKQQAADEKHRRFWHEQSDFLTLLNLWRFVEESRQEYSKNQWRRQAPKEFLNYQRLNEWRELHHQMKLAAKHLGMTENKQPASYEAIHLSLLTGLLANVATKSEEKQDFEYEGTRNRKLAIFPGSGQFKKRPKWVVAAEMIETSRLYAHTVAQIEPGWVVRVGDHLLKHHYYEPHYNAKSGQVLGFDRQSLYGLIIQEKQKINFAHVNPKLAREVFIRQGLIEGGYEQAKPKPGKFFKTNQQRIAEVEELEAKSRRRDILVNDEILFNFYDERIGADVSNLASFEKWRKTAEQGNPHVLEVAKALLMQHAAQDITEAQFPDSIVIEGMELPLSYHFEPGHEDDGVSVGVPIEILHSIAEKRLEWLVPGILREKCIAMLKSLPKQWRKKFVPVPDYVDKALLGMQPGNVSLHEALNTQLQRILGQPIPLEIWQDLQLDDYYLMNIQVLDDRNRVIARGRDVNDLRLRYKHKVQQSIQNAGDNLEREQVDDWDFDPFDYVVAIKKGPVTVKAYPALVASPHGDVALRLLDNPTDAKWQMQMGLTLLVSKKLHTTVKYLQKNLLKNKDIGLSMVNTGSRTEVVQDIINASIRQVCWESEQLPVSRADFSRMVQMGGEVTARATEIERLLIGLLKQMVDIRKSMKSSKNALPLAFTFGDVNQQLEHLFYRGFLFDTSWDWLTQYPRYLRAIEVRIEKAPQNIQKDRLAINQLSAFWEQHAERLNAEGKARYQCNLQWQRYRWSIEEYRVSLFAQTLKTLFPVSEKRLNKEWKDSLNA